MILSKNFEKQDNSQAHLTLTIAGDYTQKSYTELVNNYSKTLNIKGFRKGKIPTNILEQKFGDALKQEAMDNIAKEALDEVLQSLEDDQKPLNFASPQLDIAEDSQFNPGQDFTFKLIYDVYPEIPVADFSAFSVKSPIVEVAEEDIQKEIEHIRERNALVIDKNTPAEKDDLVYITLWQKEEGEERPSDENLLHTRMFRIGEEDTDGIASQLTGISKGEKRTLEVTFSSESSFTLFREQSLTVIIECESVKKRDLPEVDDELAQDVDEKYKTLDDLKKDLTDKLQKRIDENKDVYLLEQLFEQVLEQNDFSVPQSMLDAQVNYTLQNIASQFGGGEHGVATYFAISGVSPEQGIENIRKRSTRELKISLLREGYLKNNPVDVKDEQIDEKINEMLEMYQIDKEHLISHYGGNEQTLRNQLHQQVSDDELNKAIISLVKLEKNDKMSSDELSKAIREIQEKVN